MAGSGNPAKAVAIPPTETRACVTFFQKTDYSLDCATSHAGLDSAKEDIRSLEKKADTWNLTNSFLALLASILAFFGINRT